MECSSAQTGRFEEFAKLVIEAKIMQNRDKRCPRCWLDIKELCICGLIPRDISFSDNMRFIIYMDYKEYYNPGDDAKLLLCALPSLSKLFIYPYMDDDLISFLDSPTSSSVSTVSEVSTSSHRSDNLSKNTIVLFPSSSAEAFSDWKTDEMIEYLSDKSKPLNIIVIDAVWRNARKMAARLKKILPEVKHVQLSPESLSVYARTQTQSDRICTVEALALFLSQLGEDQEPCGKLINCVKINNSMLKRKKLASKLAVIASEPSES